MLSGTLRLTIGEETRAIGPGEMYLIPPNVPHRAIAEGGPVVVMDVFSPIREDYVEKTQAAEQIIWKLGNMPKTCFKRSKFSGSIPR